MVACTSDDQTADTALRPIEFNATGIAAIGSTRSTVDGDWQGAGNVAVMIDNDVKPYTVSDGKLTSTTPFYWDDPTATKIVTAWYPYTEGETSCPESPTVKENQSDKTNYLASDLLTATKTISYNGDNSLKFAHQVARITINVTDGTTNEQTDVTTLTILSKYTPYNTSTGTYDLLIAPQTIKNGTELFSLENADGILIYEAPNDMEVAANQHLVYNVTLTSD